MPPKKFLNLTRLKKGLTEPISEAKKQCTISKFFTKPFTEQSSKEEVSVIIDDPEYDCSGIRTEEKRIPSPFKKRQLDEETSVNTSEKVKRRRSESSKTSPSFNKSVNGKSLVDLRQENLKDIAQKTHEKLQNYAAKDSETVCINDATDFNFGILKRPKASALPDINIGERETVTASPGVDREDKDIEDVEMMETDSIPGCSTETLLGAFKRKRPRSSLPLNTELKDKSLAATKKPKIKYTQLEQQFVEIKEKYQDAILFVECGYKYRFFGDDAEIAAKVLKIFCHLDHNFMTASIPVHRLFVHVRRLVAAGYKVGVVKQTETAALKAAGSNRSAPFTRQLSALYTKSTLIGQDVESAENETPTDSKIDATEINSYLLCICDNLKDKSSSSQLIGVLAVQPSTGDIIHDSFEDNSSRSELETRLAHIQPVEILISHNVSEATEKLVTGLQAISLNRDDRLRIEKLDVDFFEHSQAFQTVSQFYQSHYTNTSQETTKLQEIINLPRPLICCLSALIHYLRDFNLENILYQVDNFSQFSSKYMQLNGNTMRNLEIFQNATDGQEKGSLFWTLNQTVTKSGARMFRSWLAKPMLCARAIRNRQSAIADIINGDFPDVQSLRDTLTRLPDMEKGLSSIYHKKCSPHEFYTVCKALETVYKSFKIQKEAVTVSKVSDWLKELVSEIPELLDDIEDFSKALNEKEARENDKTKMFTDESQFSAILECKNQISKSMQEINDHRRAVRLTVRQPSLEYMTVLGTEFLVEVKNSNIACVPKDWTKISSTKTVSRFHTPFIVEKYKELNQYREQLLIDCNGAWMQFLDCFVEKYQCYRKAILYLSTLDCLLSLAVIAKNNGYCRPELCEDTVCVDIKQGCHPVIKNLLADNDQYVPNDTALSYDGKRVMIITGPNMGGKSSYIKQVATLVIMAQIGSYVPAESAKLGLFDAIFTRMGASDKIYKGRSTFMVELSEASEIIGKATSRSLVIMDELGRGTSTHDGVAIAQATLNFFINQPKSLTLFVTHYPELAEFEDKYPEAVGNYHMNFLVHGDEDEQGGEPVTFLYQLVAGTAARSYGLNVASLANVPASILSLATDQSHSLEERVSKRRKQIELFRKICSSTGYNLNIVKELLNKME